MNSGLDTVLAMYGISQQEYVLWDLFLPDVVKRRISAAASGTRFVHYTTDEAAFSIAQGESVWLRNATCMNDISEVRFGIERLVRFFRSSDAEPFWRMLDNLQHGFADQMRKLYDSWVDDFKGHTYLISLSEHDSKEDKTGRLSMWRAYSSNNGVALVMNPQAFHNSSEALGTYSFPVSYYTDSEAIEHFRAVVSNIVQSEAVLKSVPIDDVKGRIFSMLEYYSICVKHPGFSEEKEWRVVHRPNQNPNSRVKHKIQVINGVPQRVLILPLQDVPEEGLIGVKLSSLLSRVIIGPTKYPWAIYDAIVQELERLGIADAPERVCVTDIPLRV